MSKESTGTLCRNHTHMASSCRIVSKANTEQLNTYVVLALDSPKSGCSCGRWLRCCALSGAISGLGARLARMRSLRMTIFFVSRSMKMASWPVMYS